MKIAGEWLEHSGTQGLCAVLSEAGYQALFVGGCVRNALMGVAVNDIDIATGAVPEIVTKLAESSGFHVIPTGIDHGTVTVVAKGIAHEVTTFRSDINTDGRHATVAFSTSVEEDARRRDFTMNALYAHADGLVLDPLGGLPDLLNRHVRFVGDADRRIAEDYLRILRFFRFQAWYGNPEMGLDAEGLAACATNADGIAGLSRERIGAEMRKLLSAPDPAPAVSAMEQVGVLTRVLPGATACVLPILVHLETDAPNWLGRLAALGGANLKENLRLSRKESEHLRIIQHEIGQMSGPAELGYRQGEALAGAIVLGRAAVLETPPPLNWAAAVARGAAAKFPVKAADLMPALTGPDLGARLSAIEERWIASDFTLSRAELLS